MTRLALHILFFFSGAAALGYQLVWSKMFSTGLGHEMPAVLAIIAAFMVGMAVGAAVIDGFVPRDVRAGLWLVGLELAIGLWAITATIPSVNELLANWIGLAPGAGRQWIISFAAPLLLLLPATAAMGATLPVMEKFLSAIVPENASIGSVYGANTFGAVVGALLAPFVLMPALGFSKSCWALAGFNVVVAAGALSVWRHQRQASLRHSDAATQVKPALFSFQRLTVMFALTGFLGISYETAGVRVLSQVLEGTVFTYAVVLAIFLLGTAGGAAAFHRWWRSGDASRVSPALLYSSGMACMMGLVALMFSGPLYQQCRRWGDSPIAVLAAETVTAATVFAAPTFFMGAIFSQLSEMARARAGAIGRALAANTLGAALAPLAVVALLPVLGAKWFLFGTAIGYFFLNLPARPPKPGLVFLLLFLVTAAAGYSARLRLVDVPPGGKILSYREGVMASVAVLADTNGHRTLRVDNRYQMGGTAAADAEYRQAHLPLLLHRAPARALFLGIGTGISLGAASLHPHLEADGVELVPEVVKVMPFFEPQNFSPTKHPNLKLHVADARRFVRARDQLPGYDVIIADVFHPYRDGAGALYTREHFKAIRGQLDPQGLFCQWLPLHQIDTQTLRIIVKTFVTEFPSAEAWLLRFNADVPVIALIGTMTDRSWSGDWVERRLGESALVAELKRLALADSVRFFGHFLADPEDLRTFAGDAPFNTDDNQRVTFLAPRLAYQRHAKPYASLLALLDVSKAKHLLALHLTAPGEEKFAERVSKYILARNTYLRGLIHDTEGRRDEAITHYIESSRLSPDFTSGYAQCLSIASVTASSNPTRAKEILQKLVEAQPERPVARELLNRLFPQ